MSVTESIELTQEDLDKFDWLNLQKDMDEALPQESKYQKLIRKCTENPLVPIGALATTGALTYGIYNFYLGRKKMSQYMMRTRVGAQVFTIAAIIGGYAFGVGKKD